MPAISVVIPTYQDDLELRGLLTALKPIPLAEIIISDGETRQPPKDFERAFPQMNIQWRQSRRGRGAQIAAGIDAATQPIIWVLHADNRPTPECLRDITTSLADENTSLACFPLRFQARRFALSLFAFMSRIDSPLTTFGDQGYAFRAADYARLSLSLSDFPLLEDVVLRKELRRLGKVRKSRLSLLTSARRFEKLGVWKTQIRNAGILFSYWRGASPAALHARYYKATRRTALRSPRSWPARRASMQVPAAAQKTASD